MNQILKLITTKKLLDDNFIIPYWKQMEILAALENKDTHKRFVAHYTQFLKDGVITQDKFNDLMQMYGIPTTNPILN